MNESNETNKEPSEEILDLVKILNEKMNKSDQNVIYYSGGLRAISSVCSNDSKQNLLLTKSNQYLLIYFIFSYKKDSV